MSTQILMDLFKFDQADLRANQNGRLSPAQQARWVEADQWSQSLTQKIALGLAAFVAIIGIVISLIVGAALWGSIISLLIALLVGGVSWSFMRRSGHSEAESLSSESLPAVERAEGIAHLREYTDRSERNVRHYYRLEIEHHSFQLFKKEQFEALKNGARYAVYYLDNDEKYIVSLEQLS